MRNLYLGGDQRTLKQKIIEAKDALEFEEHHGKREILTSYLNSVPYGTVGGQTAIGVQAASRIFFDKPVSELNLQQSALLAGLPQAPSEYNPFRHAAAARDRRNEVIAKMAQLHYITSDQAAAARAAPLEVKRGYFYSQRSESFFFEYVRQKLIDRYGERTVALGGLKVHTTINLPSRSSTSPPRDTASRARRSRRSCSPTRSRGASIPTAPTTTRIPSHPGGCRATSNTP